MVVNDRWSLNGRREEEDQAVWPESLQVHRSHPVECSARHHKRTRLHKFLPQKSENLPFPLCLMPPTELSLYIIMQIADLYMLLCDIEYYCYYLYSVSVCRCEAPWPCPRVWKILCAMQIIITSLIHSYMCAWWINTNTNSPCDYLAKGNSFVLTTFSLTGPDIIYIYIYILYIYIYIYICICIICSLLRQFK